MSAPKLDFEVTLNAVITLLQSKLNSKLSSIDSEKNDGITLNQIDSNAYSVLDLNQKVMNYDPFLVLLANDITSTGIRGGSIHNADVSILIVKSDQGTDPVIYKKMLRYMRALEEVFEENFDSLSTGNTFSIQSLAPKTITDLDSSKQFRGAGVAISFQYSS